MLFAVPGRITRHRVQPGGILSAVFDDRCCATLTTEVGDGDRFE
jgi:hypothetical protein